MILKKDDLAREMAKRCDFYKGPCLQMLDALGDLIVDKLREADFDDDVEIHLTSGLVIGAKRVAEREAVDPRNQNIIITPEKAIPYAKFSYTFRQKLVGESQRGKRKRKAKNDG